MQKKREKDKKVIGWREYVDIPEWGIHNIRAKIDTGARTSSLHVEDIKLLKNEQIRFFVIAGDKTRPKRKKIIIRRLKKGKVKSSTGDRTQRWYVRAGIKIGKYQREILVNLTSREGMNFPMLLGRSAIDETFLVDAHRSFLLSKDRRHNR
jgi:hypothetical protein